MAQYNPDFSRNAKGQYNPTSGFLSIKGGTNAYLLEDELNELQWIQNEARANLIRKIARSGCIDINDFNNSTAPGGLRELGSSNLNSFLVNGFDSLLNGYITHINSFNDSGNIVTLPEPPISGYRYDFVYLQFLIKEINPVTGDKIPKYGGVNNNSIEYSIIDNRQNLETTRRIQLQWKIVIEQDVDYINYPLGFKDENNNINLNVKAGNSNYNFITSQKDNQLFIAGTGSAHDKLSFGSIDGYVYAIPLFIINRLNSSGYNQDINLNGSVNYVDDTTATTRPDGKFSNIIYSDQIIDLRNLSALGKDQYDKVYPTFADLNELSQKEQTDINAVNARIDNLNNADQSKFDVINQKISDLTDSDNSLSSRIDAASSKETQDVDMLNDAINTLSNNFNSNISSLNSQIIELDNRLDDMDQKFNNSITNLENTVNQTISSQVSQMQAEITDLQNSLNTQMSTINRDISSIQSLQSFNNNLMNNLLLNVNKLQNQVTNISNQLADLGIVEPVTTLTSYNIDMDMANIILNGGVLQEDGSILSQGSTLPVSYTSMDDYVVAMTVMGTPDGKIGDYWIEKADTACLIKNTGSSGIETNVIAFGTTNSIVTKGQNTLQGDNVGITINQPLSNTDFIYITPLADLHGENGDIYINIASDNSSFTVYNTGSSGNAFEWFIIDTIQLMNIELTTLDLNGFVGSSSAGDYGSDYFVISGVPIMPNPVGGVGNIGIITAFNTFTLCCTGTAVGQIQCLVFKEISKIAPNAISVVPTNSATNVDIKTLISLTLDQEVKLVGTDLSGITITDSNGNSINNVATLASDRKTINITHDDFVSGTTYIVNVPAGVIQNGNTINNGIISWNFTTA